MTFTPERVDFPHDSKEKISQFQEIQKLLYEVDINKLKGTFHLIIDNQFISNDDDLLLLIKFILCGCNIRPCQIAIYAHLCTLIHLSSKTNKYSKFSRFRQIIKKYLFTNLDSYCEALFLYELMCDDFIDLPEIIDMLNKMYDETPTLPIFQHMFLFFGPELYQNCRQLYELLLFDINAVSDEIMTSQIRSIKQEIIRRQNVSEKDRIPVFQYRRLNGCNLEIFNAIAIDNIMFLKSKYNYFNRINRVYAEPQYFQRFNILNFSSTFLLISAYFDSFRCFKFLLSKNIPIDQKDSNGNNSFVTAAAGGAKKIFSFLLHQIKEKFTFDAISAAIQYHQDEILNIISETFKNELNYFQILQDSLTFMNLNSFLSFINSPSLFQKLNDDDQNLLMLAAKTGFPDLVNYIIQYYQSNIYARDFKLRSVVHYAIKSNNFKTIKLILSLYRKDDPFLLSNEFYNYPRINSTQNNSNSYTNNVICKACKHTNVEIVDYLLNITQSSVNTLNHNGFSLLHYACKGGNVEVVKYLLSKNNIDININDSINQSPLYHAIAVNSYEIVKLLLEDSRLNILSMRDFFLF